LQGEILASRVTGYLALLALLGSLVAGLRSRREVARHLGLVGAELGLVHGLVALMIFLDGQWVQVWRLPFLRAGSLALGLLVVVWTVSLLGRRWRLPSYRTFFVLVDLALLLTLPHLLLAPFSGNLRLVVPVAGLVVLILGIRLAGKLVTWNRERAGGTGS